MISPSKTLLGRQCNIKATGKPVGLCVALNESPVGLIADIQSVSGKIVPYVATRLSADMSKSPIPTSKGDSSPAAAQLVAEAEKAASQGMNKTELRYAQESLEMRRIAGEIRLWKAQAFRLRLANDTWYWPDFYVEMADGSIEMHETKGYMRDDARVKIYTAADIYRAFIFYVVMAEGKTAGSEWTLKRVDPGPARSGEMGRTF